MIDTHAHLDDPQFDEDRDAVLARSQAAGVEAIVCVGTTLESSRAAVRLAENYSQIYAAVGIHPNSCAEATDDQWQQIVALAEHPRVVALGETGLDRYRVFAPLDRQIEFFGRHLRLGRRRRLPVIIHCREAAADVQHRRRECSGIDRELGRLAPQHGNSDGLPLGRGQLIDDLRGHAIEQVR